MPPSNFPDSINACAETSLDNAIERRSTGHLLTALWVSSILIAALHGWVGRHSMNPDGVTYMDIADAYRGGEWKAALNSYRSPLYSWILMPALAITEASPDAEFAAVHAANFLVFLVALVAFHFLLTGVMKNHPDLAFPNWAIVGVSYALFLWSSLAVITLELVTPDLCVAAAVYASAGMLLRIPKGDNRWAFFIVLGLILGIGYLIKAALLAFALLMAILCIGAIGKLRQALPRVMLMVFGFAIVAAPWVYALSCAKGRFTFGDAGRLAYSYMVQEVPMLHWHGGPAGSGTPAHPDRQIFSHPDAYEFASPISGTYPPSYDYSYWAEGMTVRPQVWTHLRRVARSLREYVSFFGERLSGVISIVVLLWLVGMRGRPSLGRLTREWRILIPALYGFCLYGQVWVDWRYLGAFLTLFWLGLFCAMRSPDLGGGHLVTGAAAVAIMVVLGWQLCDFSYTKIRQPDPMREHLEVARSLRELQIGPGSPVASIGDANIAFWARLARVRIVAEIAFDVWDPALRTPDITDVDIFWAADPGQRSAVMRRFTENGARVVVARDVPPGPAAAGWHRVAGTAYSIYRL